MSREALNIKDFAEHHRLKARRDADDATIIPGKHGHLFDGFANGLLGMVFIRPGIQHGRMWQSVKRRALAVGMVLKQDGDAEGVLAFDGSNAEQARLAISLTRVRVKRLLTPEQLQHLVEAGKQVRFKGGGAAIEGQFAA